MKKYTFVITIIITMVVGIALLSFAPSEGSCDADCQYKMTLESL